MDRENEDAFRDAFREIPEIPFSGYLERRILESAQRVEQTPARRRRRGLWKPWLAAVSGVAVVAFVLSAVMYHPGGPNQHESEAAGQFKGFILKPSNLKVSNVQIGTIPGEPSNSSVIAEVKNIGTAPIGRTDVVGILAFPASEAKNNLLQSASLFFVNGPASPVLPNQTAQWTFHPVGAPHDAQAQLTEQPYLVFFSDSVTGTNQAHPALSKGDLWLQNADVAIQKETVSLKGTGSTWEAARIHLVLKNLGTSPLPLNKLRAITWYAPTSQPTSLSWSWGNPQDIRFINHLSGSSTTIAPGEQLEVYFDVVGSSQFDLLGETPHVAVILR